MLTDQFPVPHPCQITLIIDKCDALFFFCIIVTCATVIRLGDEASTSRHESAARMRQKASEKLANILPDIKYHGTLRTSVSADDFGVGRKAKQESEAGSRTLSQTEKNVKRDREHPPPQPHRHNK